MSAPPSGVNRGKNRRRMTVLSILRPVNKLGERGMRRRVRAVSRRRIKATLWY